MVRTFEHLVLATSLCLVLAGCGQSSSELEERDGITEVGLADCAIGAGAEWSRACAVERESDVLTLRHGDGGFRRFRIVHDGRGLIVADGAEPATVTPVAKELIEVSVGQERYRLPADVAEGAAR